MSVAVPLWLDLLTVGIGALQGALFAIFYKRFDLVGVIAVAILTGLGGGIVRDLLLAVGRPAAMEDKYILTAIAAVVTALIIGRWFKSAVNSVVFLDSVAMSLFAIAGTYKATMNLTSDLVAVLLGVITAVGGGVLRDVVCRMTPQIFSGGPLYATASAIGATVFVFLKDTSLNLNIAVALSAALIVIIQMASVRFRIHLKPALPSLDFEDPSK
ncbi:MAG: trimeric intracellular cation channel family protein [Actinomycetota bacterium]